MSISEKEALINTSSDIKTDSRKGTLFQEYEKVAEEQKKKETQISQIKFGFYGSIFILVSRVIGNGYLYFPRSGYIMWYYELILLAFFAYLSYLSCQILILLRTECN